MRTKSLLIGLVVAMSCVAFAQHTPVLTLGDCPDPTDEWGDPVDWRFVPIPQLNIGAASAPDVPVNFEPIDVGGLDFCGVTDIVFCSLAPVAALLPEVMEFAFLVQCDGVLEIYEWYCPCTGETIEAMAPTDYCETEDPECSEDWVRGNLISSTPVSMDINGPLDLEAELPISGNGIPDAQYELAILAALYNAGDVEVRAAFQDNFNAIKILVIDALIAAEFKSADKDIRGLVSSAAPYLVSSLVTVLAGFATLGDAQTNAALDELLGLLSEIGLEAPPGGIESITTGLGYLGPDGDADGDDASNRGEYAYFVGVLEYGPTEYVDAALDPNQTPPEVVTILGPARGRAAIGSNVTLTAQVLQGTPITYQWYKDGGLLVDETGSALSMLNAQIGDSGLYRVDVTVDMKDASVYSATFNLTVMEILLPVGGAFGLTVLAGACALAGVAGLRRRK